MTGSTGQPKNDSVFPPAFHSPVFSFCILLSINSIDIPAREKPYPKVKLERVIYINYYARLSVQKLNYGTLQTIYVTGKAGKNKWLLAEARPESVPVWYGVRQKETVDENLNVDAITGATPSGETAIIHWQIPLNLRDKQIDVFIEANNSFDHNAYYSKQKGSAGYSADNGQPSLIWRAELDFSKTMDEHISPEIIGHGSVLGENHQIDPDISKITTAQDTFSYMGIMYVDGH